MSASTARLDASREFDPGLYNDDLRPVGGRGAQLDLGELHHGLDGKRDGAFRYANGWNLRGLAALAIGLGVALIGHVVPALDGLNDYSWFIGLAVGGAAYYVLMKPVTAMVAPEQRIERRVHHEDVAEAGLAS